MKKGKLSIIKKGLYYIGLSIGILTAAFSMSQKIFFIMVFIGGISFIIMKFRRKHRLYVLVAISVIMIFGNILYNLFRLGRILPLYKYSTQAMYNGRFVEEGLYPDLFLRSLLKNKIVYVKDNLMTMREIEDKKDYYYQVGKSDFYPYYHGWNTYNFIEAFAKEVIRESELNKQLISDEMRNKEFVDFGAVNDMLRYTFLLSKYEGEMGRYFNHYWYYNHFIEAEIHMYVNLKDLDKTEKLVILWDEDVLEHIYVMSLDFYEREVKK